MSFSKRFARQIIVHSIGERGQEKLRKSSVLIVGCGALGTNMANLLARAGVGRIAVCDPDSVELSNLHRQTLFFGEDLGKNKAEILAERLKMIDSDIDVRAFATRFSADTASTMANGACIILDATDNIESRYAINGFAVRESMPWIFSGVAATGGLVMPIIPGGPCFECIYPRESEPALTLNTSEYGVLNTAPTLAATVASTMAIRFLVEGKVEPVLLSFDLWDLVFEAFEVERDPNCTACKER